MRYPLLAQWIAEAWEKDHREGIVHGVNFHGPNCLTCQMRYGYVEASKIAKAQREKKGEWP